MVNLELGAGDGGASGPAIHGVVVRAGLGDLNLSCDGRVLPLHQGHLARLDVYRFHLGVRDIPRIVQLPQVVAATVRQALDIDVSPVVRSVLSNGLAGAVIEEEAHAADALLGDGIDLMDQDTRKSLVFHRQSGVFSILHGEIVGCGVQLEFLGALGFHRVVIRRVQLEADPAIAAGGDGVHQPAVVGAADLEGHIGDALFLVPLHHLDELEIPGRGVVKNKILRVAGIHLYGLGLGGWIDGAAGDALDLLGHDGAHHAGDPDLPVGFRLIQPLGGQLAALGVHLGDQEGGLGAVAEVELHHVLLLAGDVGGLGRGVHDMAAVAGQFIR